MVDLQSTNRTKLSKVREATFGVTPATPAFKEVRNTSSSLNANPQTVVSNEIRSDRQVSDLILVGLQAGGDIGGELSFAAFDDDFEEALQSTWVAQPNIEVLTEDTEISAVSTTTLTVASALGSPFLAGMLVLTEGFATAANNKLARVSSSSATTIVFPAATFAAETDPIPVGASVRVVGFQGASGDIVASVTGGNALTSTALDFTTLGIAKGDWLKIGSDVTDTSFAGTAANNGWVRVGETPVAGRIDLDIVPSGWAADAAGAKTIRVFHGDRLRNGSTKRSNTFERQYLDHSPASYELFRGQTLNTMTLALTAQAVVTVTKSYIGKDAVISASRTAGATDVAAPTNDVMNTSSDVADLSMDGATITGPNFVMAATLSINNNLRQQNAIGSLGAVGIGNGEFNVTLSQFQTYFGSKAIYDKLLAGTDFGFSTRLTAPSTNKESYVVDLPRLEMQTGSPSVSGKNADVMLEGSAQAVVHPDLGYTIGINRFHYLP